MNKEQLHAQLDKLIDSCDKWEPPVSAGPVMFDWSVLITVIPVILQFFIKDEGLRAIINQVIQLLLGLFNK